MESWAIFKHAVRMVFGNLGDALRVTGVPLLLPLIVLLFATKVLILPSFGAPQQMMSGGAVGVIILGAITLAVCSLWSIVGWHRYVLLEEKPRIAPKFLSFQILTYLGKLILLGLLLIPLLIILTLVFGGVFTSVFASSLGPDVNADTIIKMMVISQITSFLFNVPVIAFVYRFAPLFPAAALGVPMKFSDAWAHTSGQTGVFLALGFLTTLAYSILQIPQLAYVFSMMDHVNDFMTTQKMNPDNLLTAGNPLWMDIYGMVVLWLQLVVGASILTTIYGRYVEGREIPH